MGHCISAAILKGNFNPSIAKKYDILEIHCKSDLDEFNTVNLSNYRSIPEYLAKYIDLAEQLGV